MIRYTLRCDQNHRFESWFQSAAAYDTLAGNGALSCPDCGSARVEKAPMAPAVATDTAPAVPAPSRAEMLARLKREIEAKSDYVGMNFVAEARAIHEGAAPERSIHGEAKPEEARKLIEDGIPVAPLPFTPTRKLN